jgi:hypothetical protein
VTVRLCAAIWCVPVWLSGCVAVWLCGCVGVYLSVRVCVWDRI